MTHTGLVVYNPTAGGFPSGMLAEKVAEILGEQGWRTRISASQSGQHLVELASQAAQEGLDALFVMGGDGSMNLATKGLIGTDTALGVLPAGTSNVMAQELGLTGFRLFRGKDVEESAEKLACGNVQRVDVGRCNGEPFLLWAGVGLDGFLVHRIEPRRSWEKQFSVIAYISQVVWNINFWNGVCMNVHIADQEIEGEYLLAVASNIRLYMGGLAELSPNACMDDGKMDLWLFKGDNPVDSYQRVLDLASHRHLTSDHFQCIQFDKLSLSADIDLYVQLDAEPFDASEQINIQVDAQALNLLVPIEADKKLFLYEPQKSFTNSL